MNDSFTSYLLIIALFWELHPIHYQSQAGTQSIPLHYSPTLPQDSVLIFQSSPLPILHLKGFLEVAASNQPELPELCGIQVKVIQHEKLNTAKETVVTGVAIRLF